jgi:alkylhydroperoxidase/carboxymuconolactone decarboxylase family protein YurZ
VASLTTSGNTEQLVYHLGLAKENGASEQELIEAIMHLAFYAGWPKRRRCSIGSAKPPCSTNRADKPGWRR